MVVRTGKKNTIIRFNIDLCVKFSNPKYCIAGYFHGVQILVYLAVVLKLPK